MDEWLNLTRRELEELNPGKTERAKGVIVHLFMSPHDVPEAVRGRYDSSRKRFVIDFRYISEEPTEERQRDEHLSLRIGRHSGRLHGIIIDVDALKAKSVSLHMHTQEVAHNAVRDAMRNLIAHPPTKRRAENYRVAAEVISSKRDRLFEALETA